MKSFMQGDPSAAPRASVAAAVAVAVSGYFLAGCGDGHSYPAGFEAQAARDERSFQGATAAGGSDPAVGASSAAPSPNRPAAGMMGAPRRNEAPAAADAQTDTESAETASASESVIADLRLPEPPPVVVADGDQPFQKKAKDPRFEDFRRMCARYLQLKRELLPYAVKMAEGTSTAQDRAMHAKIEKAMEAEYPRINRYLWNDRWTQEDRAAMGWILNGEFAPKR